VLALCAVMTQAQNAAGQGSPRPEAAARPEQMTAAQPTAVQPAKAKLEMGPPDPSKPPAEPPKAAAPQQPPAPQPTVQLKPGEVPGIAFDTQDFNFGRVPAGSDIAHDFWFTNTGNGPLEILSAKPS